VKRPGRPPGPVPDPQAGPKEELAKALFDARRAKHLSQDGLCRLVNQELLASERQLTFARYRAYEAGQGRPVAGDAAIFQAIARLLAPSGEPDIAGLWQAVYQPGTQPAFPTQLTHPATDVVGHEAKLTELVGYWREALHGQRQAVVIKGVVGIGKARLASQFARAVYDEGAIVAYSSFILGQSGSPLSRPQEVRSTSDWLIPVAAAVTPALLQLKEAAILTREAFAEAAGSGGALALDQIAATGDRARRMAGVLRGPTKDAQDPSLRRDQHFEAYAGLLKFISRTRPLVLVLDDLDRVDRSNFALLKRILQRDDLHRIMLILLCDPYRQPENPDLPDFLVDLYGLDAHEVDLKGVSEGKVLELMRSHGLEGSPAAMKRLARLVHRLTGGHPSFAVGLIHLLSKGLHARLINKKGADQRDALLGEVPGDLRAIVLRPLLSLPEGLRRFADHAAVAAAQPGLSDDLDVFDISVLRGLYPEFRALLGELRDAGVIFDHNPNGSFRFSCPLMAALIRQGLGGLLASYQEDLARADTRGWGPEELDTAPPETITAEARATVLLHNAQDALDGSAWENADALVEEGLTALGEDMSDAALRTRVSLLLVGAEARVNQHGDFARFRNAAVHAGELAIEAGLKAELFRAAELLTTWGVAMGRPDEAISRICEEAVQATTSGRSALRSRALAGRAHVVGWSNGELGLAMKLSKTAVDLAKRSGRSDHLAYALVVRGAILQASDEPVSAQLEVANEAIRIACESDQERLEIEARSLRIRALIEQGDVAAARDDVDKLQGMTPLPSFRFGTANITMYSGLLALLNGDFDQAERFATTLTDEYGPDDANYRNIGYGQLVFRQREIGHSDALFSFLAPIVDTYPGLRIFAAAQAVAGAETEHEAEAWAILDSFTSRNLSNVRRDPTWVGCLCLLAEAATLLDHQRLAQEVRKCLEPFHGRLALASSAVCLGAVDRYRGMLALGAGQIEKALNLFRAAILLETEVRAAPAVLRTMVWYSRACIKENSEDNRVWNRFLLHASVAAAEELGMAAVAAEARTLLDGLPE
jgi:hypothetical protein